MRHGVRHTTDKHSADGEDLLGISVGADIAKAHTGQAAEGKVKGSDVGAAHCRASHRAVDVWCLQTFAQLMEPPLNEKQEHECPKVIIQAIFVSSVSSELGGNDRASVCAPVYVHWSLRWRFPVVSGGWHVSAGQGRIRLDSPGINRAKC